MDILLIILFDVLVGFNSRRKKKPNRENWSFSDVGLDFEFYFILIPRFLSNETAIIRRNDDTTSIEMKLIVVSSLFFYI